jgi:hypothetical protein
MGWYIVYKAMSILRLAVDAYQKAHDELNSRSALNLKIAVKLPTCMGKLGDKIHVLFMISTHCDFTGP